MPTNVGSSDLATPRRDRGPALPRRDTRSNPEPRDVGSVGSAGAADGAEAGTCAMVVPVARCVVRRRACPIQSLSAMRPAEVPPIPASRPESAAGVLSASSPYVEIPALSSLRAIAGPIPEIRSRSSRVSSEPCAGVGRPARMRISQWSYVARPPTTRPGAGRDASSDVNRNPSGASRTAENWRGSPAPGRAKAPTTARPS